MSDRGERYATWLLAGLVAVVVTVARPYLEQLLGVPVPRWLVFVLAILSVFGTAASTLLAFQAVRFALRGAVERRARLDLLESNYGRLFGWHVEVAGMPVAALLYSRFEDMFWDSYRIEPLVTDAEERHQMLHDGKWWHQKGLVFRNRRFHAVADGAFAGGDVFTVDGRVIMRGLYLDGAAPDCWERIVMWTRRRSAQPS
jgi:hypothetical protein